MVPSSSGAQKGKAVSVGGSLGKLRTDRALAPPSASSRPIKGVPRSQHSKIKAVEVDMAGCSYNPEPEAHQVGRVMHGVM